MEGVQKPPILQLGVEGIFKIQDTEKFVTIF